MYNLGTNFNMVYHHKRMTRDRGNFLISHEEKPENFIPEGEEYITDVSDKVIISLECAHIDEDSKLPDIIGALVPVEGEKLYMHHDCGDAFMWFKLHRKDELIATFLKDDEPSQYTIDEYMKDALELHDNKFDKDNFIKLVNHFVKGHSQNLNIREYKEEDIIIVEGL